MSDYFNEVNECELARRTREDAIEDDMRAAYEELCRIEAEEEWSDEGDPWQEASDDADAEAAAFLRRKW